MAKLAYYASLLPGKESQFQTPEGYRIYKDTPIARSGSQEYFGRELKKNEGYDSIWDLKDDQKYEVFRPLEEVTAPETLASFEGKSVLDEHPSGDRILVDAIDEFDGVSKGHGQNVRVGDVLDDGETSLVADLHVKHAELNIKIDNGTREVSCGYTFTLAKDDAGRLIMTKIRGNHIAVVPRGRAGPEIAIGDAWGPVWSNEGSIDMPIPHYEAGTPAYEQHLREQTANAAEWQRRESARIGGEAKHAMDHETAHYDANAAIPSFYFPDSELQELSEILHPLADAEYPSPLQFFNGKSFKDGLKDFTEFQEQHSSAVGDAQPDPPTLSFFNGRPYQDGLKAYNKHLASKGAK